MPLRADTRILLERALRGVVIAALAVMLWQSLREPTQSSGETVTARGLGDLADWSSSGTAPGGIHARLESIPNPPQRAWLAALAGAGTRVTWSGDVPAVMIDAQPIASPSGATRILVAAPRGSSVAVSDDVGPLDMVQTQLAGVRLALGSTAGQLSARAGGSVASTEQRDSVTLRPVLVIGNAGWESKFVVAALEEEGWKADAFIRVAPGVGVTQGSVTAIDTSRYSAVIALDGAAAPYANRIIDFARAGGGVILTPQASALDAFSSLRTGAVGRAQRTPLPIQASGSVNLATLPFAPIVSLRNDAVPLERRAGSIATAARRVGAGRVVQLGHEDTWRWRMSGGEGAVGEHRAWWTEVVSGVAYAPAARRRQTDAGDGAPMAGLVAAVGRATAARNVSAISGTPSLWLGWLFVLLAFAVVGEVASRRLRGAS